MNGPTRLGLIAIGLAGMTALAAPQQSPGTIPPSAQLNDLMRCRAEKDDRARLACYDAAAGRLSDATAKGDVVVIDRAQAEQAHREAFGFNLPSLDALVPGLGGDEQDAQTAKVKSVRPLANGRFVITLDTNAVWRQTDGELNFPPRPGDTVTMTKGSLGGFFLKVGGQPAVKAKRDE